MTKPNKTFGELFFAGIQNEDFAFVEANIAKAPEEVFVEGFRLAVSSNNVELTNLFIANRGDVNQVDEKGDPLIHFAAMYGAYDTCKILLAHGADANARGFGNSTALQKAASEGKAEVCGLLLAKGADIDAEDENGVTALFLAELGAQGTDQQNKDCQVVCDSLNSLHSAAFYGNYDLVEYHLTHGADVNLLDKNGASALHYAARGGDNSTCALLAKHNPALLITPDLKGFTPIKLAESHGKSHIFNSLHEAAFYESREVVEYHLDRGADINEVDQNGCTVMHYAAKGGDDQICEIISGRNPSLLFQPDNEGDTPMHLAALQGSGHAVRYLLDHGAPANAQNAKGEMPLHQSCFGGHDEITKMVLQANPALVHAEDKSKNLPLHHAAARGHGSICRILVDEFGANVNAMNEDGQKALHQGAENGHLGVCKYFIEDKLMAVDSLSERGSSALHFAAGAGHTWLCDYLVGRGANVNLQNVTRATPLIYAASEGYSETSDYLIKKDAKVNLVDEHKNTALHYAAMNNHKGTCELLQKRGATFDLKNAYDQTASQIAKESNVEAQEELKRAKENYARQKKLGKETPELKEKWRDAHKLTGETAEMAGFFETWEKGLEAAKPKPVEPRNTTAGRSSAANNIVQQRRATTASATNSTRFPSVTSRVQNGSNGQGNGSGSIFNR